MNQGVFPGESAAFRSGGTRIRSFAGARETELVGPVSVYAVHAAGGWKSIRLGR